MALNKPFGFSEYGPHASSNPPGDYDYRKFIEGIKKNFPRTCYFMCWNAKWSMASNQFVKEMLSDPAIANRDELPKELFATAKIGSDAVRQPEAKKAFSGVPVEGNWKLTFEDNFEGDKLDASKWIPSYEWGQTHNYNAYCDPANVLIEKGLLRLKVEDRPSHDKKHTSAVITSYNKFSQKYGYFEGRFRIPTGKGLWPAFWMLPYPQHWPPEIDIFETIKDDPQIYMTYHWDDKGHKSYGKHWTEDSFSRSEEFNTYGLLWEPDKIVWYIDGVERSRFTEAQVIVSEPMYLLINFGIDAAWPGPCDATTPFPSYYECDWIAAAQTKNPVRQALVSSTGTFWDTVILCALTGLVLVNSDQWMKGHDGAAFTKAAFKGMTFIGPIVLSVSLLTFVFATIIGWSYYGEKASEYLFGARAIKPYRWLWVTAVMVGSLSTLRAVWSFADIMNALRVIPNIISLFVLLNVVVLETRKYLWNGDINASEITDATSAAAEEWGDL